MCGGIFIVSYLTVVPCQVMECHILLYLACSTTSSIFPLPTISLIPPMYFILCPPRALFPPRQSPLKKYPRYPSCLLFIIVISFLVVPAIRNTSWFLLATYGTLKILWMNHISAAFSLFITLLNVQVSQPYDITDHM